MPLGASLYGKGLINMIQFSPSETRVAYSMLRAAKNIKPSQKEYDPFEKYSYLWIAFNNIYQVVSDFKGRVAQLRLSPSGDVETRNEGRFQIPRVDLISEREQIDNAVDEFSEELKERLIKHESTNFFVYRVPKWHGNPIERDIRGQSLNGVLIVARTVSEEHPVWSPIDTEVYERYIGGKEVSKDEISLLTKQIVNVLYAVRNNLFHGGKRDDDANDVNVVKQAIPLLLNIVSAFTH
jgi:hypothetical protein